MKTNGNKNVNKNVKISRTSLLALLFTAILILSAGIGTVYADGPVWTAKPAWNAPDVGTWVRPALADLDNDGDYDLLIGEYTNPGPSYAYENTGSASSPTWTAKPAWDAPSVGQAAAPAFADMDNDGDYDLLIGENTGVSYAYENTGSASSPAWTAKPAWDAPDVGMRATPTFADLDNDGDYDLLIGEQNGVSYAYENTASPATDCVGDCYAGADCMGDNLGTGMTCSACLAAGGISWNITADKCSGDLYCPDTCIDISSACPVCSNGADDDSDGLIDCADPGCACCCDYTETDDEGVPCVPELASVFLLGTGLLMLVGYVKLSRRRRRE